MFISLPSRTSKHPFSLTRGRCLLVHFSSFSERDEGGAEAACTPALSVTPLPSLSDYIAYLSPCVSLYTWRLFTSSHTLPFRSSRLTRIIPSSNTRISQLFVISLVDSVAPTSLLLAQRLWHERIEMLIGMAIWLLVRGRSDRDAGRQSDAHPWGMCRRETEAHP